jgi:putative aldouronate transport system substrate-binding protein
MKRTFVSTLLTAVLTVCALAGCTSAGGGKADSGKNAASAGQPAEQPAVKAFIMGGAKFPDGEDINNNPWMAMLRKETGVNLQIQYGPAAADEYMNKLNLMLASGEIPDLFVIPSANQSWLMDNAKLGAIMQLDGKLNAYPNLKNAVYPEAWDAVTYNGGIYGVPVLADGNSATDDVYIRKDWLDKLKLDVPKTLDDFVKVGKAFKEQDPDGDGKADTLGLIAYDNMQAWSSLFGAFGVIPGYWMEKNGSLVPADIQPEMKEALTYIHQLFADKILDNEWPITKKAAYEEKVANGKAGLYESSWAATRSEIQTSQKNDPNANWIAIAPPVGPEGKQGVFGGARYKSIVVISSKAKNADAILKLLDWQAVPANRDKFVFGFDQYGENFMYTKKDGSIQLNFDNHNKYGYRQQLMLMQPKELNEQKMEALGAQFKLNDMIKLSMQYGIPNAFTGAPTPSMVENQSALDKLRVETFTKIIIGELPVSAFDDFVTSYKAKGGDKMIKEVADWYKNKK